MENSKITQEQRTSIIEALLNNHVVVDDKAIVHYNALIFTQPVNNRGTWYMADCGQREVKMTLDEVIERCVAEDARLAEENRRADLVVLADGLSILLSSPNFSDKNFDITLVTCSQKQLRVFDSALGVLAVSDHRDLPPEDYMLYIPSKETLGQDNWPIGDRKRRTLGERLKDVDAGWPDETKKIALRSHNHIFTFYRSRTGKTSVIVSIPDGNVLCRISAW